MFFVKTFKFTFNFVFDYYIKQLPHFFKMSLTKVERLILENTKKL